jgi:hypothetical protein
MLLKFHSGPQQPPEAASACSELLEQHDAQPTRTPRERARQFRCLGAICLVTFLATLCFVVPLLWHLQADQQQQQQQQRHAPPSRPSVWA